MYFNSKLAYAKSSIFGFEASLTPAATAAASAVEQAFTVTTSPVALKDTDLVFVSGVSSGNNVAIGDARVNTSGQVVIQFINPTAGSLTHAAGTFRFLVVRL